MSHSQLVETSVQGLSITVGEDGVWLNFKGKKKQASINISLDATRRGPIIGDAILEWCKQVAIPTIDVDAESWKAIKQAASESTWIPQEHYFMNDWVSDVCRFLREGWDIK